MAEPQTVEIETAPHPAGSVIWLHGLGADGHDFEPIVPQLRLPQTLALRFVFPHAPVRPVTINGGMAMRAWYDIISFDRQGPKDEQGIRASSEILAGLVERECSRGIAAERIVLAGFSQGGAIAIDRALRSEVKLAGLMALSTYLPLPDALTNPRFDPSLPVFMAHGLYDPVLAWQLGRASADAMIAAGLDVEWHDYAMPHAVCPQEIADIGAWLRSVFGA